MIDENQIPILGSVVSLETLKLTPEEVFVLSRINGNMTIKQISQMIGFPIDKTMAHVQKLLDNQVITFKNKEVKKERTSPPKVEPKSQTILSLLDEEDKDPVLGQIPRQFRQRVLLIMQELEKMNFFEALEVTPSASSQEIHKNYLRLVKEFHPDSFRGKNPGHYQRKVERIFEKIQEGYQEIHVDSKRASYLHQLMENRRTMKDDHKTPKSKYEYKKPAPKVELRFADADSQYEMGLKEEKKGNLQTALNFYQMAVNLNPQRKQFEEAFIRVRKLMREGY